MWRDERYSDSGVSLILERNSLDCGRRHGLHPDTSNAGLQCL
jgi:hypothetical protein